MNDWLKPCEGQCQRVELIERLEDATVAKNAALEEIASLVRRLSAAKAEVTKQHKRDAAAPLVEEVLTYWRDELSTARADIAPGGTRWAKVAGTLTRRIEKARAEGVSDPSRHAVDELKQAVEGCKRSAFHQGANDRRKRFVDTKHVFKDEATIEDFIEDARKAKGPAAPPSAGSAPPALIAQYEESLRAEVAENRRLRAVCELQGELIVVCGREYRVLEEQMALLERQNGLLREGLDRVFDLELEQAA